jgi:acyl carrier protein
MANNLGNDQDIKSAMRGFITDTFLPSADLESFTDTDSFMETGIVDSTGVLELLEFIEETFGIMVEDEEVVPANLDSLEKLAVFIQRKIADAGK